MVNDKLVTALSTLAIAMVFSAKDWSTNSRDAWLYGVLVGWEDDSIDQLQRNGILGKDDCLRMQEHRDAVRLVTHGEA